MDRIFLQRGDHKTLDAGGCAMEFVAWVAGEPHSDHPQCVSPCLGELYRRINDQLDDVMRQRLIPGLLGSIGTNTGATDEVVRGFMCADWAIRVVAPWWLERAGLFRYAKDLRRLAPVVDQTSANDAHTAANAAYAANAAANAAAAAAANAANATNAAAAAGFWAGNIDSVLDLLERMAAVGRADVDLIEERVCLLRSAPECATISA